MRVFENNSVSLIGKPCSKLEFSHEVYGEGFYSFKLKVPRLSSYDDVLPITISERLLSDSVLNLEEEEHVKIEGQLRSYNKLIDGRNRLILTEIRRENQ